MGFNLPLEYPSDNPVPDLIQGYISVRGTKIRFSAGPLAPCRIRVRPIMPKAPIAMKCGAISRGPDSPYLPRARLASLSPATEKLSKTIPVEQLKPKNA